MQYNMNDWIKDILGQEKKTPTAILSFPSVQLMDMSVKEVISSAEAQSKGMALIAERVRMGAAVGLMDLSVEAECFGSEISTSDDEVPTVTGQIVSSPEDAEALKVPGFGSGRTRIYRDAAKMAMELVTDRPVFGGTIGPFSLAGRLMDVTETMMYCYDEPEMVHTVLEKCTTFLLEYIGAYKEAGLPGIVMAEPLAGILSPALAEGFSCAYVKKIVDALQDDSFIIIYHNCGNATVRMTKEILSTGARIYHFGDAVDMAEMLELMPEDVIVMGNVSPSKHFRNGTPESVREETLALMEKCSGYKNFVPSSGCDIPPMSPWENIEAFFAAVDEFYNR